VRSLLLLATLALAGCSDRSGSGSSGNQTPIYGCDGSELYATAELDWIVGTWLSPGTSERLEFQRNPDHFAQELTRQVGGDEKPNIPYPTSCHYRHDSNVFCIVKDDPGYLLRFQVSEEKLLDGPNDAACPAFLSEQQSKIDGNGLQYSQQFRQMTDGRLDFENLMFDRVN
jgi:hypothetical protein